MKAKGTGIGGVESWRIWTCPVSFMKMTRVFEGLMLKPGISLCRGESSWSGSWGGRSAGCESHTRFCRETVQMAVQSPPHPPVPSWVCFLRKHCLFQQPPPAIKPSSDMGLAGGPDHPSYLGMLVGPCFVSRAWGTAEGKGGDRGSEDTISLIWCASPKHSPRPRRWVLPRADFLITGSSDNF